MTDRQTDGQYTDHLANPTSRMCMQGNNIALVVIWNYHTLHQIHSSFQSQFPPV